MALVGYRVTRLSLPRALRLDAHLLPGDASANLFENITVDYVEVHDDRDPVAVSASADAATTAPAGGGDAPIERLRMTASFLGSEAAAHHALGVTFDPDLGIVTADNPLPAGTLIQNFLVKVIATARNGAERTTAEVWTRVHVHQSVERIWLTPNPMTVHQRSSRSTALHPARGVRRRRRHRHHPDRRHGRGVGPDGSRGRATARPIATVTAVGRLDPAPRHGDAQITASFQPPDGGAPITDTATARVVAAVERGRRPHARERRRRPSRARTEHPVHRARASTTAMPTATASTASCSVVVDGLRKNHLIDPWPMLHASVNFWSAFTPGREAGATRRSEVYVKDPDAPERSASPPFPSRSRRRPPTARGTWRNSCTRSGFPYPTTPRASIDDLLPDLRERFGEHITEDAIKDAFEGWRLLANRRLFNARDSRVVLHGRRPAASEDAVGRGPEHLRHRPGPNRRPTDIQALLGGLRHNGDGHRRRPLGSRRARDRGLGLRAHPFVGAQRRTRRLLRDEPRQREARASERRSRSAARPRTHRAAEARATTSTGSSSCSPTSAATRSVSATSTARSETKKGERFERFEGTDTAPIESYPNLHARATLRKAGAPDEIDASLVKWASWLRISHAAVVTARPRCLRDRAAARGTRAARHGSRSANACASVRCSCAATPNTLLEYLDPQRSGPLKVKARPGRHPPRPRTRRGARGTRVAPRPDRHDGDGRHRRRPGHRLPADPPSDPGLRRTRLRSRCSHRSSRCTSRRADRPLNVKADEAYVCVIDESAVQNPRNLPLLPTQKPSYQPLIIGLYDGGALFHCNVFHPGGICMMRNRHARRASSGSAMCAATCSST